ncbi:MAG: 30S ribosomal protein S14 [Proteobacteria bacterium]|nr:30S ribosomal protein S14 [Pseudomonadota bacterium]
MAKTSQIYRDLKRDRLIAKYAERRSEQRRILKDAGTNLDEKRLARAKLEKMPQNSSSVRHNNRCRLTGRSRGVYRKFGLSRIKLRELALQGQIPGMTKSSW